MRKYLSRFGGASVLALTTATARHGGPRASPVYCEMDEECGVQFETGQTLTNWSSTHTSSPRRVYEPRSAQEVVRVLQMQHHKSGKVRPVGTALSPNGLGLADGNNNNDLLSLAHIDYVEVDPLNKTVTVGAGARVSSVLAELSKHGLTLSNFSSIQEQQLGGWTQVSAHGTGITLPPVDEMVLRLQLATPTEGLITLSSPREGITSQNRGDDWLFRYAKVGLGSLGVVTELTLSAIPKFNLEEETFCLTRDTVASGHYERLRKYRHVRYMWIPYTDTVVVVVSNPTLKTAHKAVGGSSDDASKSAAVMPTHALSSLLASLPSSSSSSSKKDNSMLTFTQLRDALLDYAPLSAAHIKAVNAAEAAFWKRSSGTRVDDSTNVLGFDCGGEQLVYEICVDLGPNVASPSSSASAAAAVAVTAADETPSVEPTDISLVKAMLTTLEAANIPAPSPIEQRWTARSTAPMSPAYSPDPRTVFTWVGIIMYLPPNQTLQQRSDITKAFGQYCQALQPLLDKHNARVHWAKIEPTASGGAGERGTDEDRKALRARLAKSYNISEFNSVRDALDPRRVLSNSLVDALIEREN